MASKKKIDMSNLESLTTDPLMDQTIGAIVGTPAVKTTSVESSAEKKKDSPKPTGKAKPKKETEEISTDTRLYNYRKETVEIDGVGKVPKTISEKGEIIGRPNVPVKEKKKPITLTLKPDLYDLVKDRAAADHRTTSEYLAMIIEEYLSK